MTIKKLAINFTIMYLTTKRFYDRKIIKIILKEQLTKLHWLDDHKFVSQELTNLENGKRKLYLRKIIRISNLNLNRNTDQHTFWFLKC